MASTISELIETQADDAPALGAPDRGWLDYAGLRALAGDVRGWLHAAGIGRGDRVAIVLPNGPEMAAAFVTVAQTAVTAPLNPSYREEEFAFYLEDLKARALIVEARYDGPALAAARRFGLAVLRLSVPEGAPAGRFELAEDAPAENAGHADTAAPDAGEVALILHTSGTTSRPKIVPLLQSNVAASALNILESLDLSPCDRCLNVMPLFHIHGLVAAVSASLAAGGSIWCAPGFDALKFFA